MVSFQSKNNNLGTIWRALDDKMLIYFMSVSNFLGYLVTILYILCSFGTFFPVLVSCTKKNLATLATTGRQRTLIRLANLVGRKKDGATISSR
jgi:hypothetical protein